MASTRRKGRSFALQALYEIDVTGHKPEAVVQHLLEEQELSEETLAFVRKLVNGITENRDKLDETIKKYAPAWPLAQIPAIDRNILRLAIFEILIDNEIPIKVAINEAVELAKKFGAEGSPRFVNGVLGAVSSLAADRKT